MDAELVEAAWRARGKAHAPYSGYAVGAALRTHSGAIHAGCNVENASYPEGWCAETSAIAAMIAASSAGDDRRIASMAIVADRIGGRLITPCGGCRQRLAEFGDAAMLVRVAAPDGGEREYRLGELLPASFALDR